MNAPAATFEQRFAHALRLAETDRLGDARRALESLAHETPTHAPSRQVLATVLQRLGDATAALHELDRACTSLPRHAGLHRQRAELLSGLGRHAEAIEAARTAHAQEPHAAENSLVLGRTLLAGARANDAADVLAAALAAHPRDTALRRMLVRALLLAHRPVEARDAARDPALVDDREMLAGVIADFAATGAWRESIALFELRVARHPGDAQAWGALAAARHRAGLACASIDACDRAIALQPHARAPHEIRATALIDRGDAEAGLAAYRDLLRAGDAHTAARHLVLMHYDPAQDNATLFERHREFAARHLPAFGAPFTHAAREPQKVLRIGWISPRFEAGPVATFLEAPLRAFDREHHRHVLIALQRGTDAASTRLAALAHEHVDASGLDDLRLLQRLREFDLDVAIDLAGHSTANRIGVLAQRVAPIQIAWLDYFDTTAVPAMDAWLSDPWLTPADSAQRYSERLLRLASGRFCYTPPAQAPSPEWDGRGAIVFASFNRLAKFNAGVIAAWAHLLRRVPDARLELGAHALAEAATRDHLAARFAEHGVDPARIAMHGPRGYADLLAAYRGVDIALDPFPFSGCTTTCDALWMGCAAITQPGATFVSRQSAALLQRLGHDEWIARSSDDYVERAVAMAASASALRAGRAALRERVRSRLCDAPAQARELAEVFRALWQERCALA